MHENQGNSVIFYAHYTKGGVSKTGLTVTIDVYEVIRDGTKTQVTSDGACTEIGDGLYRYLLASGSVDAAAEYVGVFHTATDTVDCQDIPAIWVIDRAGTEKLDSGVTLADDAITAGKFDESTAFPVKSADTGATQIARVGADSDTLETLSDQMDAIKTETAGILADTGTDGVVLKASGLATDAAVEIASVVWGDSLGNYTGVDEAGGDILTAIGNIAEIKAKTDNLPTDPADESSLEAAITAASLDADAVRTAIGLASANLDTQLAGIQADLDNPDQYKADVSGLATASALTTVDGIVDAIKAKTDNLPSDPADQSILAGAIAALPLASDYTPARAAKLDYLDAAISSRATSGEGTISWTYTLTGSDNVSPIQYATVWVTSDAGGTAIEASGQTDASGQITFLLNAGTYYVWRKKRGYRFSNPDVEVVA